MRRLWRLGLVLAIVPALLAPVDLATLDLAPGALAQVPKRESAEIGDKQQDLQQTQKRLFEERQKAADARKREAGVLSELEGIDRRLSDKRQQVAALDGRLKRAGACARSTSCRPRAACCRSCSRARTRWSRRCSSGT
jgi:hypothetical protein